MRRFVLTLAGLLLLAVGVGIVLWSLRGSRAKSMPDGSILRIEKVSFGKEEHIRLGGPIEKLKAILPPVVVAKLFGPAPFAGRNAWYQNAVIHSNEPALYFYISRHNFGKGYRSVDAQLAEIVDQDGCVYYPTQTGGYDDGLIPPLTTPGRGMKDSVDWFRFEAFPRHEKKFRFLVYETPRGLQHVTERTNPVEFVIANPAPPPPAILWPVEPLPITRSEDGVSFALTKVSIRTNIFAWWRSRQEANALQADFSYAENGRPSTNWQALDSELGDASGNFIASELAGQCALSVREPAWKLRVKFFGSERAAAASNAVWAVRGVPVPEPGKFVVLDQSHELQGIPVRAGTFGGAGDFTYSNGVALAAASLAEPGANNSSRLVSWPNNSTGKYGAPQPTFSVQVKSPHVAFEMGDLADDQRLTVRAVDDQGREFYGYKLGVAVYHPLSAALADNANSLGNWYQGQGTFLAFDLPPDAKTVDLTFCVHTCRTAEFIFQPPGAIGPSAR